jgi:lipoprotein-anchoring transpeptidase ErfK/SrfK
MMERFRMGLFLLAAIVVYFGLVLTTSAEDNGGPNKKILVKTDRQILIAVEDNKIVYEFDVVTGRPGKETKEGKYAIFRKHEDYTSQKYGSEMPFSMFFSKDGKAIHGTHWATLRSYLHVYITESVGSHGCVGLTKEDAEELFKWAHMGTTIYIMEEGTHENERLKAGQRR